MECNHIVPEAESGPNTLDNCIPLCFDCHAEVGAYNPKHPKGNKFTNTELRAHRDRWFEKVRATHAVSSAPETLQVDRTVFEKVRRFLPSEGTISFLRRNNFAGFMFRVSALDEIHEFERWAQHPDSEFLDSDLEGQRSLLAVSVQELTSLLAKYTFSDRDPQFAAVPADWEDEHPEHFENVVKSIHTAAQAVCDAYDALIRTGRRKLQVA